MGKPVFVNSIYIIVKEDKNGQPLVTIDVDVDEFCNALVGLKDEKGKAHLQSFAKQFTSKSGLTHNTVVNWNKYDDKFVKENNNNINVKNHETIEGN